ncbi:MAG: alanine--tRNA ligase, partial [Firmicutes bacterium]|nr:alanine--tRNA ligase [Bacillota bacterium]
DNFWEIGTGPCGPCSEIYYDLGPERGCGAAECAPGCDCDRYLEIWNLVFTQFNREPGGELTLLKQKNIDTGAGLERLATALQGAGSFYETDLFQPLIEHFSGLSGLAGGAALTGEGGIPLRIVTEHSRGIAFMVADGVLPSNEGRGYVLRRLIRRAARQGRLIGLEGSFLAGAMPLLAGLMGGIYPEIKERRDFITQVIETEERRFQETLAAGLEILEGYIETLKQKGQKCLPGELAFKLYDTYGFPTDLTAEILSEQGMTVDHHTFEKHLSEQQKRARAARSASTSSSASGEGEPSASYTAAEGLETIFTGYDQLEEEAEIRLILVKGEPCESASEGDALEIFLDSTPFYAEAGGQVGDSGVIEWKEGRALIDSAFFTPAGQIVHAGKVEKGRLSTGERVTVKVDQVRRRGTCRSHTATHLLHRALREQLGEHVNQAGSLVNSDRLRFDFTHFKPLSPGEKSHVEETVNRMILENLPVTVEQMTLAEAERCGARALFSEKYDSDTVRVVSAGAYSKELCGGTHVNATGEIGLFRLTSEEGIGSGMRRIEALTGMGSYRRAAACSGLVQDLALILKTSPEQLLPKAEELLESNRHLERTNRQLKERMQGYKIKELLKEVEPVDGVNVLSAEVSAGSFEELRAMTDQIKNSLPSVVAVLGSVHEGKVQLVGTVTADLVKRGLQANSIIAELARRVGGGGGGRPAMAQAGGRDPAALPEALQTVNDLVRQQLSAAGGA